MVWDGNDRRREQRPESQDFHDLVVRIDANLSNFMSRFEEHAAQDKLDFEDIRKRTTRLERFFYGAIGAGALLEFVLRIVGK